MSGTEATAALPLRWREPRPAEPVARVLPVLRAAVASAPDRTDLEVHLAWTLLRAGAAAEIIERTRAILARDDADSRLLFVLGRAALSIQDDQLAVDALRLAAAKGTAVAFGYLAKLLARLDRPDEALEAGLRGLQSLPSDSRSLFVVAHSLLDHNEAERLWALCVDLRKRGAWSALIASALAVSAAVTGKSDEVASLVNPSRWFSASQLAAPDDFNRRLSEEIVDHACLDATPAAKVTRGAAARIDRFESVGGPLAQELLARIRAAVEAYVRARQAYTDDPMIACRPESVALSSWAMAVQDDGHQNWHIHRFGWVSGVYYVTVPKSEPSHERQPGGIEFGLFTFGHDREDLPAPRWHVMPQDGQLLLFPSYYAHRTWPTDVRDRRISVAFDICPTKTS